MLNGIQNPRRNLYDPVSVRLLYTLLRKVSRADSVSYGNKKHFSSLYPPPVSAVLTDSLGVRSGFCLAVCHRGNDQYQTKRQTSQNYPAKPAETTSVFCLCGRHRLNRDIITAAFRTYHGVHSFMCLCVHCTPFIPPCQARSFFEQCRRYNFLTILSQRKPLRVFGTACAALFLCNQSINLVERFLRRNFVVGRQRLSLFFGVYSVPAFE